VLRTSADQLTPTTASAYLQQAWQAIPKTLTLTVHDPAAPAPHRLRFTFAHEPGTYYQLTDWGTLERSRVSTLEIADTHITMSPEDPTLHAAVTQAWGSPAHARTRIALRHYWAAWQTAWITQKIAHGPDQAGPIAKEKLRRFLTSLAATSPHLSVQEAHVAAKLAATWKGNPLDLLDTLTAVTT